MSTTTATTIPTTLRPTSDYSYEVWTADGHMLLGTVQNHVAYWTVMDEQPFIEHRSRASAVRAVVAHAVQMGWV